MNKTTNTGFGKLVAGGIVAGMGLLTLLPGAAINTLHYTTNGFREMVAVSQVGTDLAAASLLLVSVGLIASYFMQRRRAYSFA